jgi:transposase
MPGICLPSVFGVFLEGDTATAMGRPKAELVLSEAEHAQLSSMARSRSIPAALALRARIVLAAAEGTPNSAIAERLQTNGKTAGKWRTRFIERRINGLYDELRPGKPRTIDDERVAELINKTLHTKPADGATHWSVRAVAAETAMSHASVHRYFKLFGLQPHRSESFRLSTDPFFIDRLRDVVGLYLSPQRTPWCCALTRRASARRWSARGARAVPRCAARRSSTRLRTTALCNARFRLKLTSRPQIRATAVSLKPNSRCASDGVSGQSVRLRPRPATVVRRDRQVPSLGRCII